jgi:hypothetical protein
MTVLAIGDARCSLVMMQNTSGRLLQRCRCPGQNRVCLDAARIQRPDCFQITLYTFDKDEWTEGFSIAE